MLYNILLIVQIIVSAGIIVLVLMQHGKGADAGAAFGSGASSTVFGARGAGSFLTRATTILAVCFFATSIALFYMAANRDSGTGSVTDGLPAIEAPAAADVPSISADDDVPSAPADNASSTDADIPKPAE